MTRPLCLLLLLLCFAGSATAQSIGTPGFPLRRDVELTLTDGSKRLGQIDRIRPSEARFHRYEVDRRDGSPILRRGEWLPLRDLVQATVSGRPMLVDLLLDAGLEPTADQLAASPGTAACDEPLYRLLERHPDATWTSEQQIYHRTAAARCSAEQSLHAQQVSAADSAAGPGLFSRLARFKKAAFIAGGVLILGGAYLLTSR